MKNPLQITFHDLQQNPEIQKLIEEKFEKLKLASPDITKCHVVLEKQSKHHQKANLAVVRLDLKAAHFDIDLNAAQQLHADLVKALPGYLVPRLVREDAGEPAKTLLSTGLVTVQ